MTGCEERPGVAARPRMAGLVLGGVAATLAAAFAAVTALGDLSRAARPFVLLFGLAFVAYAGAVAWVVRRPPRGMPALGAILLAGLGFRLLLVPTAPTLSTDLYRYLWDGQLAVAGISPYAAAPTDPKLAAFRDAGVYPRLNHRDWRSVYPPGAQLLFAGVARLWPRDVLALKLVLLAFDAAVAAALVGWLRSLGRPPAWVLVYAWHPLVVVEAAGSGHLDVVAVALSVAALWAATRGREGWAGALVGLATLVKLYPALLLAAVVSRRPGRALVAAGLVVGAGYALYAGEGGRLLGALGRYVAEEEWNPGLRGLLAWALGPLGPVGLAMARRLPLVLLGAAAVTVALLGRGVAPWRRALWLTGGYLAAVPSLFPWYGLSLVPVLAVAPAWPWLYLTGAVALSYLIFAEPVWRLPAWVPVVEYLPVLAGLALAARSRPRADARAGQGESMARMGVPS